MKSYKKLALNSTNGCTFIYKCFTASHAYGHLSKHYCITISKVHLLPFNLKQTNPFCKLENREADNYLNVLWVFDAYMKNSNHAIPVRMKTPECHAKQYHVNIIIFSHQSKLSSFL